MLRQLFAAALTLFSISASDSLLEKKPELKLIQSYKIVDCKGDCDNLGSPTHKPIFYTTNKGEKIMVAHGQKIRIMQVPAGYKLLSCYCKQKECIIQTPNDLQWTSLNSNVLNFYLPKTLTKGIGGLTNMHKPSEYKGREYTQEELKEINKRNQEAYENL